MKLISKRVEKDGSGSVKLRLEQDEDLWHAYNLINEGDEVRGTAVRRITSESSTGSTDSRRIRLNLTIRVDKIIFSASPSSTEDALANGGGAAAGSVAAASSASAGATLHLSGPIVEESQHVKMGAHHTLDLETGRDFTLIKGEGEWDSIGLDRIRESTEAAGSAEVGAIVCGEGIANICLITQHTTIIRQRIEVSVPRKRKGGGTALGAEKATSRFHQQIYAAVTRHFDFDQLKVVIIASPGFTKEAVMSAIMTEATRIGNKTIITAKPRFLLLHSSSHHVHSLTEVLSTPEVATQLKDTKFAREGLLLSKFQKMMGTDELRAWYGEAHVLKAAERGAVSTLLISDALFKSSDFSRRKRFVKLVEDVKAFGAEVLIFSSMHESGEQLNNLSGLAAILSYPLDIETVELEEQMEKDRLAAEQLERDSIAADGGDAEAT